jgi:hypothetical protein
MNECIICGEETKQIHCSQCIQVMPKASDSSKPTYTVPPTGEKIVKVEAAKILDPPRCKNCKHLKRVNNVTYCGARTSRKTASGYKRVEYVKISTCDLWAKNDL